MSDLEEHDIDDLHRAVLRERQEPYEGREPVPIWMGGVFVLLIAWGGWYLGRYDAKFDSARSDMQSLAAAVATPAATEVAAAPASNGPDAKRGATLFAGRCAACHQASGSGMVGLAPQLDGSDWVVGDPERVVRVVLHGLNGPIEVSGKPFPGGAMPPWGASMSDSEIADVLTYIRSAWSNKAAPIDEATVKTIRESTADRSTPWTAAEL